MIEILIFYNINHNLLRCRKKSHIDCPAMRHLSTLEVEIDIFNKANTE